MEQFTPRRQLPKLLLLNFLTTFLTERIHNEQFDLCVVEIRLDEIKKLINSQENESRGNEGPTVEFYKFFCIELAPAFLGVYYSC